MTNGSTRPAASAAKLLIAFAAAIALSRTLAAQDEVRLKTGAVFEGLIIAENDTALTLQFPGGTLELRKSQIAAITRSAKEEDRDLGRAMLTLSRFNDSETFHFLYREGRRVGYRVLTLKRESRAGIPGYALHDRMVFTTAPGVSSELDVQVTEFVDAGLEPREFNLQVASGLSSRAAEGRCEDGQLRMTERIGGRTQEQSTLFRDDCEFPSILFRRLASEPVPDGGYKPIRLFRPRDLEFGVLKLERQPRRMKVRGQLKDLLVFRASSGDRTLETWLDYSGNLVREELGSDHLVSQLAKREDVLAFAQGTDVPEDRDLELEFISESTGLRLLRPDNSWDAAPGNESRRTLVSFLHAGYKATVDVFDLSVAGENPTEENLAMKILARMREDGRDFQIEGPAPAAIGEGKGLRFTAKCRRRDQDLVTLGAIVVHGRDAIVLLGAAPASSFDAARPGIEEVFSSLRFLEAEGAVPPKDPFADAEKQVQN